jgi:dTDP-glucose 4,6-dehydratase
VIRRPLVTRGAGFIGSALVRHLITHTALRVLVDTFTYDGNSDLLAGGAGSPGTTANTWIGSS